MILIKKNKLKSLFVVTLLSLFIYFVPILYIFSKASSCIIYPFVLIQNSFVYPLFDYCKSYKTLKAENEFLRNQRDKYLDKYLKNRGIKNHYENIKEVVQFSENYNFENAIFSQVILKSFLSNENFFYLNKGLFSGVQEDMVAIYKNNLIGRVKEVYPFYSKVVLITDKSCKVASFCSSTKTKGITSGKNAQDQLKLLYVSHLDELKEGDTIFSSGEGLVFPEGFALGYVESFEKKEVRFKVKVKPFIKFSEVDYCYLIKKV